jgi:hypothetical protein
MSTVMAKALGCGAKVFFEKGKADHKKQELVPAN